MKRLVLLLTVAFVGLMVFTAMPSRSQNQKGGILRKATKIENQYIVVLDDAVVGEKGDLLNRPLYCR